MNSKRSASGPRRRAAAGEAAWIALTRSAQCVRARIEADLKAAGHPPLEWYDVLLELDRGGSAGLRQSELCARLLLEKYNLSRRIDRMEAAGLVTRAPAPDDARGQIVSITPKGGRLRRAMYEDYARSIDAHVADRLGEADARRLAELLAKLG